MGERRFWGAFCAVVGRPQALGANLAAEKARQEPRPPEQRVLPSSSSSRALGRSLVLPIGVGVVLC